MLRCKQMGRVAALLSLVAACRQVRMHARRLTRAGPAPALHVALTGGHVHAQHDVIRQRAGQAVQRCLAEPLVAAQVQQLQQAGGAARQLGRVQARALRVVQHIAWPGRWVEEEWKFSGAVGCVVRQREN